MLHSSGSRSLLSLAISATIFAASGLAAPAIAADDVLADRVAHGDITQPGGARRLQGDQTAALVA